MDIKVKITTVFGREVIRPACDKAEVFCELVKQTSLTERDVGLIKGLGYTVEVVNSHPATL